MNKIAERLIAENSKTWLAETLGISRPTLDKRLRYDKWKKLEKQKLLNLSKQVLV